MTEAEKILREMPCIEQGIDKFYGQQTVLNALNKALNLPIVVKRSELLNSFCKWQEKNWDELQLFTYEQQVEMFLAI